MIERIGNNKYCHNCFTISVELKLDGIAMTSGSKNGCSYVAGLMSVVGWLMYGYELIYSGFVLYSTYQGIFASEKNIHIVDNPIMRDDEQSECEEGRVLKNDVHHDCAHFYATTARSACISEWGR